MLTRGARNPLAGYFKLRRDGSINFLQRIREKTKMQTIVGLAIRPQGPDPESAVSAAAPSTIRSHPRAPHTSQTPWSDFAAIVSPVKKSLSLAPPARQVAWFAVALDLPNVSSHRLPSSYLSLVLFRNSATHVVTTVPLEPTSGIVWVNPSLLTPHREWLAGIDAEVVEETISASAGELRVFEPTFRKFASCVRHVLAAKNTELQHLFRCQVWTKRRIEVAALWLNKLILISALHHIIYHKGSLSH
jgi:hypothetical protein